MSLVGAPKPGMVKEHLTGKQKVRATLARMLPGREHWIDALFTVAVVGCVLVGLRTIVFGWHWWLAAAVGVLLGLLVGHVQATYRWPAIATVLLSAVLYFLLGGILAVRDDLLWGLVPTGQTFVDLLTGPLYGWMDLLTMVAPVDARGPYVALVLFLALLATILTYATARVTTSRWRLLATPFALLVVVLALGTPRPAAWWVHGIVLALLLIGWLALRDHHDPTVGVPRPRGGRPAVSRVVAGGVLLALAGGAGVLLGPRLPGLDGQQQRQVARSGVTPHHDLTVLASPLSQFREYTKDSPTGWYDQELLHVEGVPATTPMRLASLDSWNGSTWGMSGRGSTDDPSNSFQQFGRRVGTLDGGRVTTIEVTVPAGGYRGRWLLTTGQVEGIEFRGGSRERLQGEAWLDLGTDTVLVPPGLRPGDAYRLRTELPPRGTGELPQELPVARGSVSVTGDPSFVDARIEAWAGDTAETDPWSAFRTIATTMRQEGAYTDGLPASADEPLSEGERAAVAESPYRAGHGRGRLEEFLGSQPLAGNDEQYAAALALIGNRLGIPTRVVVGATATDDGVIRGRDIHAWVEVKRADGSWFQVLPQTFLPDRQADPAPEEGPRPWDAPPAEPPPQPPPPQEEAPEPTVDWASPSTWPVWAQLLCVFVGLPVIVLVLTPFATTARRALRRRRGTPDQRIGRVWNDLVEEAEGLGHRLPRGGTRAEQAAALGPRVDAIPAALRADTMVFGDAPPDVRAVAAWQREVAAVRRRLRRNTPVARRLLATCDPRPLFSRQVDVGLRDAHTPPDRKVPR